MCGYIFATCTASCLIKGSRAPVLGFTEMLVSVCPLGPGWTGVCSCCLLFSLSFSALHVQSLPCPCASHEEGVCSAEWVPYLLWGGALHLTRNADPVAEVRGQKWKSCFVFPSLQYLFVPAPPAIQGCAPAPLRSFGRREGDIYLASNSLIQNCKRGFVLPRFPNLPCPGTPASGISPQTTSQYFGFSSMENCNILDI